jgi:hypothetical protein
MLTAFLFLLASVMVLIAGWFADLPGRGGSATSCAIVAGFLYVGAFAAMIHAELRRKP